MKIRFLAAVWLLLWILVPSASNADIGIFQGEGVVAIGPDGPVVAKIKARNEALKQAVGKAVAQAVPAEVYQARQNEIAKGILVKAGNYVQSFELLEAKAEEGHFKVSLEARVNLDLLNADIGKLGGIQTKDDKDVVRILIVATSLKLDREERWPALEDPLRLRLEMLGLFAVSREETDAYLNSTAFERFKEKKYDDTYDLERTFHARYALIMRSLTPTLEGALCPTQGTASFLDLGNRKVLAVAPYHLQEGIGCESAAEAGARFIFASLSEKLQGRGIFDQAPQVAFRITFIGLKGYRETTALTSLLTAIPDMKSVFLDSFATGGRVVFSIKYEGSTEGLVESILALRPKGFKLSRRVTRDDSLLFEAEY